MKNVRLGSTRNEKKERRRDKNARKKEKREESNEILKIERETDDDTEVGAVRGIEIIDTEVTEEVGAGIGGRHLMIGVLHCIISTMI